MNSKLSGDFMPNDPIFEGKNWKKFENQGAPSGKRTNPKWPPVGVKIGVFDILSNFELYFLAESVLLDDFHAKELIFWGFGKFQLSVFAELLALVQGVRPFSVKISVPVCVVSHSILLSTKTARYSVIIWPSLWFTGPPSDLLLANTPWQVAN